MADIPNGKMKFPLLFSPVSNQQITSSRILKLWQQLATIASLTVQSVFGKKTKRKPQKLTRKPENYQRARYSEYGKYAVVAANYTVISCKQLHQ